MEELFHELGIDPRVIAAMIPGFLILWWVLAKFLFRPVLALIKTREEEIKSTYDTADAERVRAEEFRADYERRLAGIEAEARARLQTAIKEAEDAKNEIITDARNRSEDIMRRGQEGLAREREKTLALLRENVVGMSLEAAGRLLDETLDEARHRKLVNDFIDGIGAK